MLVRECTAEDFPAVLVLLGQLWPDLELDPGALREVFGSYLEDEVDVPICAVLDGGLAGFASLNIRNSLWRSGRIGYLDVLVVDERRRRRGIGAALVDRASSIAREKGCSYLELDSAFHREGAHEFYARQGFERFGIMLGRRLGE